MGFVLVLIYVALLFFRPMEWVPGLVGVPLVDYVAVLAIVASLFTLATGQWTTRRAPQHFLMVGFLFAIGMSHVRHTYFAAFLNSLESFGKIILLYFIIVVNTGTLKRLKILIAVMILGCLFLSLHGILQWHTGAGFGGQPPLRVTYYGETRVQAYGVFNDPNDLALMLITILPFVLNGIHRRGAAPPTRLLSLIFGSGMLYCIFRTNSRGGWLALGAMLTAYFGVTLSKKKLGIVLGICAILALFALPPSRMETATTEESSARGRLIAWADGNRMLKQWPVFGAGYNRFVDHSEDGKVAHNSFVHCYAELGLFGYFFWLALVLASLKDAYVIGQLKPDDPEEQEIARLARVSVAALIGYLAAAFFLSRTYIPHLYILFAMIAALRSIHARDFEPVPGTFEKRHLKYTLALELLSIPLLYVFLRLVI